jgi:hypothetical protein
VLKAPNGTDARGKAAAGSALAQSPTRASAGSARVIRQVSQDHRDALKRLVARSGIVASGF